MRELAEILHNLNDHAQVMFRLLHETTICPETLSRLYEHILLEESENESELARLNEKSPSALLQKALDHSFLIQRMIKEEAMPLDIKEELLDHFIEEQVSWMAEISGSNVSRQWTVGPMRPQGG